MLLKDSKIPEGGIIRVIDSKNITGGGGFAFNFTDLSKQIYDECKVGQEGPHYRAVTKGINICGVCKFERCIAFNEEIVVPLNNIWRFDLIKKRENLKCPACKGLFEPKTVAFFLCYYKIKGKNFENGKVKNFEFNGKSDRTDSLHYYDPLKWKNFSH